MNNGFRPPLHQAHQSARISVTDGDRRHTYSGAVAREDLCKRLPYDDPDPPPQQSLGSVFPGRATSEVPSHDHDTGIPETVIVERVILRCSVLAKTLIVEGGLSQPVEGDGLEITRRYDAVCIDIRSGKRNGPTMPEQRAVLSRPQHRLAEIDSRASK